MRTNALTIEVRREAGGDTLVFSGALTELARIDVDPRELGDRVVLDLQEVRRINSAGAQVWTTWISRFSGEQKLTLTRLPPVFVHLASIVDGMIPARGEIESFFVPYFDPSCGDVDNVLYVKDLQFSSTEVLPPPFLRSQVTNEPLEIDVSPSKYFQFLRRCYPRITY